MFYIENDQLKIAVKSIGAELDSIYHKKHQLEYLWNGDPKFWKRKSPVLFPIVGALKENSYFFEGKTLQLEKHGFAREMEFQVRDQSESAITFFLQHNESTLQKFPFQFEFRIKYSLLNDQIRITYEVENFSKGAMYFSVGGHPAFKIPLIDGTSYEDYFLEFNEKETTERWLLTPDGLVERKSIPILVDSNILPLKKELFYIDAIVLKNLRSTSVSLRSKATGHVVKVDFDGFPYLGIWAAPDADFVCIEPWCGIADHVDTDQQIIHKEGINPLKPNEIFTRTFTVIPM